MQNPNEPTNMLMLETTLVSDIKEQSLPTICTICSCKEKQIVRTLYGFTCRAMLDAGGELED